MRHLPSVKCPALLCRFYVALGPAPGPRCGRSGVAISYPYDSVATVVSPTSMPTSSCVGGNGVGLLHFTNPPCDSWCAGNPTRVLADSVRSAIEVIPPCSTTLLMAQARHKTYCCARFSLVSLGPQVSASNKVVSAGLIWAAVHVVSTTHREIR